MKNNNLYNWLSSLWTNIDTSTELSEFRDDGYGRKIKYTSWIHEWQMGGCSNSDKLPSIKAVMWTASDILKYKKGFWSKYKLIWLMCIKPFLKTKWTWSNWSNFSSNRPYYFSFNLLTMKIRQEMYETVGDYYGIEGMTRYRFQERFIWSDKWTEWKTFKCYDIDDHTPKTDEEFEQYECDYVGGDYDY